MGFIERELERIQSALGDPSDANHAALWAAQQALAWALEPSAFRAPFYAITGNPAGSRDYLVETHQLASLRNDAANAGAPLV